MGHAGVYRHPLPVRITHWLNVLFLLAMLGSGLQIFNAHPALYWGDRSDPESAWLALDARPRPAGEWRGIMRLGDAEFDTTGWLGVSGGVPQGFPDWATIPGSQWLAMGRRWHLFFAWLLVANALCYAAWVLGHAPSRRQLLPRADEWREAGRTFTAHLRLRRLRADAERGYNLLQKLSYLAVVFLLGPLMVVTGLAMSPWLDAAFPWLTELFAGRQSARSLHFIAAFALVLFTLVHVAMVLLVGPVRHLRAMFTGYLPPRDAA